ncbi:MAG: cytochrome ubiquinol oxidase subunit I, partial [Xanthobacteraceae bacterium]
RTADAASPVPGASVAATLALFVIVYGIVFAMGIYYINRLIAWGPPRRGEEYRKPQLAPIAAAEGASGALREGG